MQNKQMENAATLRSHTCGWSGTVQAFLSAEVSEWRSQLVAHHESRFVDSPSAAQLTAWSRSFAVLRSAFTQLLPLHPPAACWSLIFEYELPRERGRRPDVVVLAGARIFVLEFKDFATIRSAHIDQVAAYARDLQQYHAASHGREVLPVLVPTRSAGTHETQGSVLVAPPHELAASLTLLAAPAEPHPGEQPDIDLAAWLAADYAPLPSLVSAARAIFRHEPLPQIRRAQSAGIPDTVATVVAIAKRARERGERHLALVTGVPGAGKTLVGLQLVYQDQLSHADTAHASMQRPAALFLSGNGPLVKVLQHALGRVFVQDVHGFLSEYGAGRLHRPEEHIWVYDEAQRAWDATQASNKRKGAASEPEEFLRLGGRMDDWALLVGLIGEGQEIHLGEEAGLGQWNEALAAVGQSWVVHCPAKVLPSFSATTRIEVDERLDLTVSLRSHLAEDVQRWVQAVLDGRIDSAAELAGHIQEQGFEMYVTRDLEAAKAYARERYAEQDGKRYGLLASSRAANLPAVGIHTEYQYTMRVRSNPGPWYNDPPSSPASCCQLRDVATEFICQGLELDFPIVAWGNDLTWSSGHWSSPPQPRSHARDPHRLRVNSYRVLLSRGRDGFAVFIPPTPDMDATYQALVDAGLAALAE